MAISRRPIVLCVDDELRSLETLKRTLDDEFEVVCASTGQKALEILERQPISVVVCDQRMPGMTGVELLTQVRQQWPNTARLILSGYTDSEDIIRGLNEAGIFQYITKPWHPDHLLLALRNACRLVSLESENALLATEMRLTTNQAEARIEEKKARLRQQFALDEIVRASASPLNAICERVQQIAPYDISVMINGPSGTGKELFARALHYNSLRANKPFVVENCGAMPDDLLASELFGHRKGAFTGAMHDHIGLFEQADGGTIFLDEIGDVSAAFQVMLLRVLQEREIRRVGDDKRRPIDVRVIAATNRDLEAEVAAGRFREDLYYRLAEMTLSLPPLSGRKMDIPVLANYFLHQASDAFDKDASGFTDGALQALSNWQWPGNVRELQNEVRRMLVLAEGDTLGAELISPRLLRHLPDSVDAEPILEALLRRQEGWSEGSTLKDKTELLEKQLLRETMIRHKWNKSRAADELGLSRVGLRAKLERYGLEPLA
ncbi:sigma-54-dependent transcriptional regulator [Oceanobacter mangrovi]|uniref:sigma-54-dependent transcriptional regulator n=1 Tax=Oceanobacter mangrovi TaxID=2862510 RepID=UPI001C8EEDC6|nr:sigma-54 dependent transcriptional regulator [Oceanobacter mangrovi]